MLTELAVLVGILLAAAQFVKTVIEIVNLIHGWFEEEGN